MRTKAHSSYIYIPLIKGLETQIASRLDTQIPIE